MKIFVVSIYVDDQRHALEFYTEKLGFNKKNEVHFPEVCWLTLTSKEEPDGLELLLEVSHDPTVAAYRSALLANGIPAISFRVADLDAEYKRLCDEGVRFTQIPDSANTAIFDDTCGNLVRLVEIAHEA